jgi:WhiB family redox-sensing transcriptional regulator
MSAVVLAWTPPAPSAPPGAGDRWWHLAACAGADTELFAYRGEARAAKAVCSRCPVREACLADAVTSGDAYMVLGGMTPPERRRAFAPGRRCRSLRHELTGENTGDRGRCLACKREKDAVAAKDKRLRRERGEIPDGRGSRGPRDSRGRFTSRQEKGIAA